MHKKGGRPLILGVLFVVGLMIIALSGCGGQAGAPQGDAQKGQNVRSAATEASTHDRTFVGKVEGTGAFVALVVDNENHVLAYVCDGEEEASTDPHLAEWFTGAVAEDGSIALKSADGATLSADVARGGAGGTFTQFGEQHAYSAESVSGDEAGLYRKTKTVGGEEYVGGWILLESGASRGAIRNTATGTVKFNSAGFVGGSIDLARPSGPVNNSFDIEQTLN